MTLCTFTPGSVVEVTDADHPRFGERAIVLRDGAHDGEVTVEFTIRDFGSAPRYLLADLPCYAVSSVQP